MPHSFEVLTKTGSGPPAAVTGDALFKPCKPWCAYFGRLVAAYLVIYMLPFPLTLVGIAAVPYQALKRAIVVCVGKAFFGLNITVFPAGSGDTTYNYVELLVYVIAALVIATVLTVLAHARPVQPRSWDRLTVYARYYLAAALFGYAWAKIIPNQFPVPGPDRLMETYGDSSPMGLLWAFMGASTRYQVLAGLGELTGAILLLWRRTTLLGALVSTGLLANVVALNFCYDVPVKLYSAHLLLVSLFLVAPHAMRLFDIFILNRPGLPSVLRPYPIQGEGWRIARRVAKPLFVLAIALLPCLLQSMAMSTMRPSGSASGLEGIYGVESFACSGVEGRENEDKVRWVRFGVSDHGVVAIQFADGTRARLRSAMDRAAKTLTLTRRKDPNFSHVLMYEPEASGALSLSGDLGGGEIQARLRKLPGTGSLLLDRGFHWISEYPFNQ